MGKTELILKIQNKELQTDLEYLFASTGYFDLVGKENTGAYVIDPEVDSILKKPFSEFLGEVIEGTKFEVRSREAFFQSKVKSVAVASINGNGWSNAISAFLGRFLFIKGYSVAYLSLSPLNLLISEVHNNESGFGRWLIDSKYNRIGNIEKYAFYDGEIAFIGAPAFNPNAGDAGADDIGFMLEVLSMSNIEFLIIDIGLNLDLERVKIFLAADFPVIGLGRDRCHEKIFHKYFEGALPILTDDKGIERDAMYLSDLIEKRIKGEVDEEEPIWH